MTLSADYYLLRQNECFIVIKIITLVQIMYHLYAHLCVNILFNLRFFEIAFLTGKEYQCLLPAPVDSDLDVKYTYNELLVNQKIPWKSFRIKLNKSYKNRIPSKMKLAPFLDAAQIIGQRDHISIVQIPTTIKRSDFLVVNTTKLKVESVFHIDHADQPYLWECLISPDLSKLLLKPNLLFALRFRIQSVEDCLKIVCLNPKSCQYEATGELFKESALDLIMCFDPRYKNTRIAIGNICKRGQHVLCLYSLKTRKIVQKTYGPQYQRTQNLVFTPDGDYLAALIVTYILGPNMFPQRFNFLGVMVYSTGDLQMLHMIQCYGTQSVPNLTPAAIFPVFSTYGDFLCMGSGSGGGICRVEIYHMPPAPTLKSMCRRKISRYLTEEEINKLLIPNDLKDYLLYKPLDE